MTEELTELLAHAVTPLIRVAGREDRPEGIVDRMGHYEVPGAQLVVIQNGEISFSAEYGTLERGSSRRVTSRSLFQAASISKALTALAVLRLVARGALDLDRPVNDYLRSWRLPDNEHTRRTPVTLRALLSHTAGTTVHGFPGYAAGAALPSVPQILDGEPPANTKPVRVDAPVGEQFRYSGGGTTVVQQLLTDVTGEAFPDLMRELVLQPLEMTESTFAQPLPHHRRDSAAAAHDENGVVPGRWHVYPEMAAAGLWTTAKDLARYVLGVQSAITGDRDALLPQELARAMVTPQNGGPNGLGPQLQALGSDPRFLHSGGNRGFICRYVGFIEHRDGVVLLTNGAFASVQFLSEVVAAIGAACGWQDFVVPKEVTPDPRTDDLDAFVGGYELRGIVTTVRRASDHLVLEFQFGPTVDLLRISGAEFIAPDGARAAFDRDAGDQQVSSLRLTLFGERHVARRKAS